MAEDEDVAKLKTWWKEYGLTIVAGAVLGLGGIAGWNAWQGSPGAPCRRGFGHLRGGGGGGDRQPARRAPAAAPPTLLAEFPNTGYATLAAFVASASASTPGRLGRSAEPPHVDRRERVPTRVPGSRPDSARAGLPGRRGPRIRARGAREGATGRLRRGGGGAAGATSSSRGVRLRARAPPGGRCSRTEVRCPPPGREYG